MHPALTAVAARRAASLAILMTLIGTAAHAIGLGQVSVQSPLGQPLRATVPLLGVEGTRPLGTCFNARLSSADGAFITAPRIALTPGTSTAALSLSTSIPIAEPALTLMVEMGCGEGMQREFSLLLDPPMNPASTPLQPLEVTTNTSSVVRLARERRAAADAGAAVVAPPIVKQKPEIAAAVANAPVVLARPVPPKASAAAARNVLRLTSRDGSDVELMNAIGLRLARANSLSERATPTSAAAIPNLAQSAEARAAQARFAALLRDDGNADGRADANASATNQKLQDLQAKMLILENETLRLKQASQRDAAALDAARASAPAAILGSSWVAVLVAALLALCACVIAWLLIRVKHLKQHNMTWNWEENVAAVDTDAGDAQAAAEQSTQEPSAGLGMFANTQPTHHETIDTPSTRPASNSTRVNPSQLSAPLEFKPSEPFLPPAKSQVDSRTETGAAALAAGSAALAAGLDGTSAPGSTRPATGEQDMNFEEIAVAEPAVEEISDVMQEAEFWISLHDSQRAIEVLEPYATSELSTSPLPWLYLFELYADGGQRANYDVLHQRFQRVFNGKIPTWEELEQQPPPTYLRGIEDVPHICDKIVALWWTEQSVPYLESLLLDDRDGNRVGFDLPVYREIMFLISIAYEIQQSKKYIKPALGSPGWTIAA